MGQEGSGLEGGKRKGMKADDDKLLVPHVDTK